jgi:Zn-finger nucleic acid-binding protein
MNTWNRLLVWLGRCPYCGLHYLTRGALEGHLEWSHASKRKEWET